MGWYRLNMAFLSLWLKWTVLIWGVNCKSLYNSCFAYIWSNSLYMYICIFICQFRKILKNLLVMDEIFNFWFNLNIKFNLIMKSLVLQWLVVISQSTCGMPGMEILSAVISPMISESLSVILNFCRICKYEWSVVLVLCKGFVSYQMYICCCFSFLWQT